MPPWTPRIQLNNVKFDNPWSNYPGGDPFPMPYRPESWPQRLPGHRTAIVTAMDYDTSQHESRPVESQHSETSRCGLACIGELSRKRHADTCGPRRPLNPAIFLGLGPCTLNGVSYSTCSTTANTNQRRRYTLENPVVGQGYGYVNQIDTGGNASYNGLLLSVQRRAARGVTVSGNYTWSHCISDLWQETAQTTNADQGWSDPNDRRHDRGNCARFRYRPSSSLQFLERGGDAEVFKHRVASGRIGLASVANF